LALLFILNRAPKVPRMRFLWVAAIMPSEILPQSQARGWCGGEPIICIETPPRADGVWDGVGRGCERYFPSACAFKASNVFADVIILCSAAVSTRLYCGFLAKASAMS
jgi:hypothetical protein